MATANYTSITIEQINTSLGRETFYGEEGTVYLSKYSNDRFTTNAGEITSTSQAFELIAEGKVSGTAIRRLHPELYLMRFSQ